MNTDDGMAVMDSEIGVIAGFVCEDMDRVFIQTGTDGIEAGRKRLAEFLWHAAYMIDSEGRYKSDEYPARNYT